MNSKEITIVGLSVEELEGVIYKAVKNLLSDSLKDSDSSCNQVELITRLEACKLLNISLPTLTKYVKHGIIPAHRMGNRILFKKDEVLDSLKNVQKQNFF